MSHHCVRFEPGSYIGGVVPEESAEAEGGGFGSRLVVRVMGIDAVESPKEIYSAWDRTNRQFLYFEDHCAD